MDNNDKWQRWYTEYWTGKTDPTTGDPIYRERIEYRCPYCFRRTVIRENYCPTCGEHMRDDGGKKNG